MAELMVKIVYPCVLLLLCACQGEYFALVNPENAPEVPQEAGGKKDVVREKHAGRTTFFVPRSNKIEISFTDKDGVPPPEENTLHMDLLSLYKQVVQDVLQRDKLQDTVRGCTSRLDIMEVKLTKLETLETEITWLKAELERVKLGQLKRGRQEEEIEGEEHKFDDILKLDKPGKHRRDKWTKGGKQYTELDQDTEYESYPDTEHSGTKNSLDLDLDEEDVLGVVRAELERQGQQIAQLQEEQKLQDREANTLSRLVELGRNHVARLEEAGARTGQELGALKRQVQEHGEMDDRHAAEIRVLKTGVAVNQAKLTELSSEFQWLDIKVQLQENANVTRGIQRDLREFQETVAMLYRKDESVLAVAKAAQRNAERCFTGLRSAQVKLRHLKEDIKRFTTWLMSASNGSLPSAVPDFNETASRALMDLLESSRFTVRDVEETASTLYNLIHQLNKTQAQLLRDNRLQQRQADDLSLDVEQLKDEVDSYAEQLASLELDVLAHKEAEAQAEGQRQKLAKQLHRLRKDFRRVSDALDSHGTTRQPTRGDFSTYTSSVMYSTAPSGALLLNAINTTTDKEEEEVTSAKKEEHYTTSQASKLSGFTMPVLSKMWTAPPRPQRPLSSSPVFKVTTRPLVTQEAASLTQETRGTDTYEGVEEKESVGEDGSGNPEAGMLDPDVEDFISQTTLPKRKENCTVEDLGKPEFYRVFPRSPTGTWMRDSGSHDPRVYVSRGNVKVNSVREYASIDALRANNITTVHKLPYSCSGTGHAMFRGNFYCNKHLSNRLMKYSFSTGKFSSHHLHHAGFNNTFPYAFGAYTDIDFAVDEMGLWVIYSTWNNQGDITVAKLDSETLEVKREFVTKFRKDNAINAFMVCGKLHVTDKKGPGPIKVSYIYDTYDQSGFFVKNSTITFGGESLLHAMLDYNARERRLYAWNLSKNWDGLPMTYDVHFKRY